LRRMKGLERHASLEDGNKGAIIVDGAIEALRVENLRHQANVRHGDGIPVTEPTGEARAGHVRLEAAQPLGDPMTIPCLGRRLIGTELRLEVLEHANVVERVNIASDDL